MEVKVSMTKSSKVRNKYNKKNISYGKRGIVITTIGNTSELKIIEEIKRRNTIGLEKFRNKAQSMKAIKILCMKLYREENEHK